MPMVPDDSIAMKLMKKKQNVHLPFQDKLKNELKRFRKPFRDLSFKLQIARKDEICSIIIAACIDSTEDD